MRTIAKGKSSFFFMAEQYSIVQVYQGYFIHSSTDGHLSCFRIVVVGNNAAMNKGCIYSFKLVFQVSLHKFPEVESLGHEAVPFLIF